MRHLHPDQRQNDDFFLNSYSSSKIVPSLNLSAEIEDLLVTSLVALDRLFPQSLLPLMETLKGLNVIMDEKLWYTQPRVSSKIIIII